jgi:hypothetical protein
MDLGPNVSKTVTFSIIRIWCNQTDMANCPKRVHCTLQIFLTVFFYSLYKYYTARWPHPTHIIRNYFPKINSLPLFYRVGSVRRNWPWSLLNGKVRIILSPYLFLTKEADPTSDTSRVLNTPNTTYHPQHNPIFQLKLSPRKSENWIKNVLHFVQNTWN